MTQSNQRIPRPIGITEQCILYNNTYDEQYHINIYQGIIHHYIRNNFSYCGIYYNIEQFSKLIKVHENEIMRHITSYGKELQKLNKELTQGDMVRALTNLTFSWGMEDRSAIQQQIAILQSSQGNSYKPFISGELTKALKVGMDSNNQMMALLKTLMPSGQGALLPYEDPEGPKEKAVTVDDVVRILKANQVPQLLQSEERKDALYMEYDIQGMPEVNALKQVNMDTSKEGLNILDITNINESQLVPAKVKGKGKKLGHENRREEEFEIDPNSDEI